MSLWLLLIVIGVILAIIGFAGVGQWLVILGVILLLVGVVLTLMNRGGRTRA